MSKKEKHKLQYDVYKIKPILHLMLKQTKERKKPKWNKIKVLTY